MTTKSTPPVAAPATKKPVAGETPASMVAGGLAGMVSTVLTNPLDVMRTRLSASREATGENVKKMRHHFRAMISGGVFRGLTIGIGVNLAASVPSNSITSRATTSSAAARRPTSATSTRRSPRSPPSAPSA